MLQALLVERFGLKFHRESREGPVFLLLRGSRALKLVDAKDKQAYPWSGGLGGGGITGDGMAGTNESMEDLAKRLSPYFDRPVLNRTGISGSFDFRYEYSPAEARPDINAVILESLQELGLKLSASKAPVDAIVIDHAEKPSAN